MLTLPTFTANYGFMAHLPEVTPEAAKERITQALKAEGFGILTEIDVAATFHKKLDREYPPYFILGACNPELAWQALHVEPGIGLLLPCNVCVWAAPGGSGIGIAKPEAMFGIVANPALKGLVADASERLQRALTAAQRG